MTPSNDGSKNNWYHYSVRRKESRGFSSASCVAWSNHACFLFSVSLFPCNSCAPSIGHDIAFCEALSNATAYAYTSSGRRTRRADRPRQALDGGVRHRPQGTHEEASTGAFGTRHRRLRSDAARVFAPKAGGRSRGISDVYTYEYGHIRPRAGVIVVSSIPKLWTKKLKPASEVAIARTSRA